MRRSIAVGACLLPLAAVALFGVLRRDEPQVRPKPATAQQPVEPQPPVLKAHKTHVVTVDEQLGVPDPYLIPTDQMYRLLDEPFPARR